MSDRYDAVCARKNKGKTYYTKIGAAFPLENGGYAVRLSALPIPNEEGEVCILLFEPKERDDRGGSKGGWG